MVVVVVVNGNSTVALVLPAAPPSIHCHEAPVCRRCMSSQPRGSQPSSADVQDCERHGYNRNPLGRKPRSICCPTPHGSALHRRPGRDGGSLRNDSALSSMPVARLPLIPGPSAWQRLATFLRLSAAHARVPPVVSHPCHQLLAHAGADWVLRRRRRHVPFPCLFRLYSRPLRPCPCRPRGLARRLCSFCLLSLCLRHLVWMHH